MRKFPATGGFTLPEVLVSITIVALISVFSLLAFRNVYRTSGTRVAALEITDALRTARSKTLSGENDTMYGVRIGTSTVTRFIGSMYSVGSASNTVYTFEAGAFATGTLVQNAVDIVFSRLTGTPSATGTIYIVDVDTKSTTTVTLEGTGLIE